MRCIRKRAKPIVRDDRAGEISDQRQVGTGGADNVGHTERMDSYGQLRAVEA
jgi:hypothetical protein